MGLGLSERQCQINRDHICDEIGLNLLPYKRTVIIMMWLKWITVSWSLTSLFSTNMAISETNGHSL